MLGAVWVVGAVGVMWAVRAAGSGHALAAFKYSPMLGAVWMVGAVGVV